MSEKPEALRFGVWRDRETEILRVSNTGEFLWHKDADARIANPGPDANPAMMHLFRVLRRAEAVHAENERLTATLKAREDEILTHCEAFYEATKLLSEEREKNERLREENRLWYSRAVALFWKCDTDNITAGRLQSAAKEIDAALRREET